MSRLHVRTWPVDLDGSLIDFLDDGRGVAWLHDDHGMIGLGTTAIFDGGVGPARFANLEQAFLDLRVHAEVVDDVERPGTGLVAFATLSFDPTSHGSILVVPELVVGRGSEGWFVTHISESSSPDHPPIPAREAIASAPLDRPRYAGASIPDVDWLEAVAAALERIAAGDIEKVVLARDHAVWAKVAFSPRRLAARLRERFPQCYTFVVDGFVGSTPELLVARHGQDVTSRVLAGTAPRGDDPTADDDLGRQLRTSDKDRREHELAVRTVRDTLGPFCGVLDIEDEPHLLRLANVMHLGTWCRGRLQPEAPSALGLADAMHPTAAVGGVPTDAALAVISELEGMDRGRYAGPVGWVDARGNGEFGVALRCAQLSGARARLFTGAGIVRGSLPEDELEETRVKLLAMQSAFSP